MTGNPLKEKINEIKIPQLYQILSDLIIHSESMRWTRLYNLLVVNSVLIVAWASIYSSSASIEHKGILLLIICSPGIFLGILWSFLGRRSSKYLDEYHRTAENVEYYMPNDWPRPYHVSEKIRDTCRSGLSTLSSSRWIVTWLPIVFSAFFIVLAFASRLIK